MSFDLNIYNYTINELENFLGLNENYTFNDIVNKHKSMVIIVKNDKNYDNNTKENIIRFMNNARDNLIEEIKKTSNQEDNFMEDFNKLLIKSDENKVVNKTSAIYAGNTAVLNKETVSFNDIINKNEYLNPVETYPTNVSRSYLNNLKRKTILQTIILNSLYREDYFTTTSTDFSIFLPYYFKNVLSIRLSSIQLPNVIYCISALNKNNYLYIKEDNTHIEGFVFIPDGNYTGEEIIIALEAAINTQLNTYMRFEVTIDSTTQRITISNTENTFSMIFYEKPETLYNKCNVELNKSEGFKLTNCVDVSEIYKKLGWILGYRNPEYFGEKFYITEGLYNPAYSEYIYFTLNDYNNSQSQNIIGMFSKSIIGSNILAMIPLTKTSFNVCFDNGADFIEKKREYFGPVNIQKLKIQLLNQYGEIIDLNSMDFSFSLEFELGYDW